jgi:hypothetical protein
MSEIKDEFDHFFRKINKNYSDPDPDATWPIIPDRPAPDPQRRITVILFLSVYRAPLPGEPSLM